MKYKKDYWENKYKELQPFERGAEGWYALGKAWHFEKSIYVTKLAISHLVLIDKEFIRVDDFTTENPHKKDTVLYKSQSWGMFEEWIGKAVSIWLLERKFVMTDGVNVMDFFYTKVGDDLQEKFDSDKYPEWVDFTK